MRPRVRRGLPLTQWRRRRRFLVQHDFPMLLLLRASKTQPAGWRLVRVGAMALMLQACWADLDARRRYEVALLRPPHTHNPTPSRPRNMRARTRRPLRDNAAQEVVNTLLVLC